MGRFFTSIIAISLAFSVASCGTLTGIPGHGGGKRFAVEQELVAGTARAAAKDLKLDALRGKRVAIYIVSMGDEGAGNLIGGRYSIDALLRGEHVSTPVTEYPVLTTTTTTGTVTTIAQNALNAPRQTEGGGHNLSGGIAFGGLGAYRSEVVLNPRDAQFLSAVIQSSFALRGVKVVPSAEADIDV